MQRFLVRRFFISIVTLLVVSVVIFAMSRASGDPRHIFLDDYSTQEDWDRLTVSLGLDKPYYQQYGIFLSDAMQGNFGVSIKEKRPVVEIIGERVAGVLSAVKRGSLFDSGGKALALIGQSAPNFWLGIMMMFFFAVHLGWLPPYGRQEKLSIVLPAITLGWYYVAANLRLIRSAMLDALDSEYIKLARAKGVTPAVVIWKHALRNALVPALTFAGVTLGALVTGSLVVETVFAWPGLGQLAVQALFGADYPLLQGVVMVFTMLYVAAALAVDVLYAYIDPRIRYS